jgi:catalase
MPAIGTGSSIVPNTTFPSLYPLNKNISLPVTGLVVAILTTSDDIPMATYNTLTSALSSKKALFEVVASHQGVLESGVPANESYVTTSSVLFDAVIVVSEAFSTNASISSVQQEFVREAFGHGKPIGEVGNGFLSSLQLTGPGLFLNSDASSVINSVIGAMEMPGRFPQRTPLDDIKAICG